MILKSRLWNKKLLRIRKLGNLRVSRNFILDLEDMYVSIYSTRRCYI